MKLYKATYVHTSDAHDVDDWTREEEAHMPDPEGWAEHCEQLWGEYRPFFAPTARNLYRSRSSAQGRVNLINRWFGDGAAILEEADVEFIPVAQANVRRARARRQARIDKLRAEIARLEA